MPYPVRPMSPRGGPAVSSAAAREGTAAPASRAMAARPPANRTGNWGMGRLLLAVPLPAEADLVVLATVSCRSISSGPRLRIRFRGRQLGRHQLTPAAASASRPASALIGRHQNHRAFI